MIQKRYEENMKVRVFLSEVSAEIDMALGLIKKCFSQRFAIDIVNCIEYIWNQIAINTYLLDNLFDINKNITV